MERERKTEGKKEEKRMRNKMEAIATNGDIDVSQVLLLGWPAGFAFLHVRMHIQFATYI